MNTVQIERALKSHPVIQKVFKGVYACNQIPTDMKGDGFMVINLDPSYKEGSHWVAICLNSKLGNIYFDSYGWKPTKRKILQLLEGREVKWGTVQLQSDFTSTCGQWCCFFIWHMCHNVTFEDMLDMFGNNQLQNDEIVNAFFHKHFHPLKTQPLIDDQFVCQQICRSFAWNQSCHC